MSLLNKKFEELQNILQSTNINFFVIAIKENRVPKKVSLIRNFALNNSSFEHTSTESSVEGTFLYIAIYITYHIKFAVTWKFIRNLSYWNN